MKASRLIFSNVVRIEKNGCGVTRTSAVQSMQVLLIRHQPVTQQPGSAEQSERLRPMSGNPNRSHHCAYDLHWVQIGAGSPVLYPLQAVGCGRAVVADPCQGCEAGRHQTHQHHCSRRAGCSSVRVSVGGVVPLWSRVLCGVPQRSAGSPRDTARTHWLRVAVQLVSCRVRPASWLRDVPSRVCRRHAALVPLLHLASRLAAGPYDFSNQASYGAVQDAAHFVKVFGRHAPVRHGVNAIHHDRQRNSFGFCVKLCVKEVSDLSALSFQTVAFVFVVIGVSDEEPHDLGLALLVLCWLARVVAHIACPLSRGVA
jgi:hypothetical protein